MNKHIFVFSILCGLFSIHSHAQSQYCPELSGEFTCAENTPNPFRLRITEVPAGNTMAYDFSSVAEGSHRFIADGSPQAMESGFGKGTYSSVCQNGWLVTTILLTRPDGRAYNVRDRMQMQRKAIVRIRLSLPGSATAVKDVYVCRPFYPPVRR